MTARLYGPGQLTRAQAEIVLARSAAIRDLMQTGATHGEACAAVDHALRAELGTAAEQAELILAACGDAVERLAEVLAPAVAAVAAVAAGLGEITAALARAYGSEPRDPRRDHPRRRPDMAPRIRRRGRGPRPRP